MVAIIASDIETLFEAQVSRISSNTTAGQSLEESLARTLGKLRQITSLGKTRWVVTYSGGKDSTLLAVLAGEIVRRNLTWAPQAVDVVYSDTLQEIPDLHAVAMRFLKHIQELAEEGLPIRAHVVQPAWDQTFWFMILGKGYPVPHRHFWWCTKRLKVKPVQGLLREIGNGDEVAVLSGVRFGESSRRDGQMKKAASCLGEGECGQVLAYHGTVAPIAHWKTCQVWDFLMLYAPTWGWPTADLVRLYGDAPVRFGCWTCTLVKRDRALDAVVARGSQHLEALRAFRQRLIEVCGDSDNRVPRPDGVPGRLRLAVRQRLLEEIRALEEKTGLELIRREEIEAIRDYWREEEEGGDGRIDA